MPARSCRNTSLSILITDGTGLSLNPWYVTYFVILFYCWLPSVATSVDVEHVFSKGQIPLSHVHNWLSVQSTRALLCLGAWSLMGYVKDSDIKAVTMLPDLKEGEEEEPLGDDWDLII